jgi:hypothetical protein
MCFENLHWKNMQNAKFALHRNTFNFLIMRLIASPILLSMIISACVSSSDIEEKSPLAIYFELNEDAINQKHHAVLDSVGQYLTDHPEVKLIIGFETDNQEPTDEIDSENISMRWVKAAQQYLKNFWGYDPHFMIIEERIHGRTLGDNSDEKLEPCGHKCRSVFFEFDK